MRSCAFLAALLGAAWACEPSTPLTPHGPPNEAAGQMCVVCHTCGDDGTIDYPAPIVDTSHAVCNSCHLPDGGIVHHSGPSCEWSMDCEAIPPVINCTDCHGIGYVNALCEDCH